MIRDAVIRTATRIATKNCENCRHYAAHTEKIKIGVSDSGSPKFRIIPKWHCCYHNITHATEQTNCDSFVGHTTLFEYLMYKQPDVVNNLLKIMDLRVVSAKNRWGFDIK